MMHDDVIEAVDMERRIYIINKERQRRKRGVIREYNKVIRKAGIYIGDYVKDISEIDKKLDSVYEYIKTIKEDQ